MGAISGGQSRQVMAKVQNKLKYKMGEVARLDLFWSELLQIHSGLEVGEVRKSEGRAVGGWVEVSVGRCRTLGSNSAVWAGGVEDACEGAKGQSLLGLALIL